MECFYLSILMIGFNSLLLAWRKTRYFEVLNLEDDNRTREIHLDVTADEKDQDAMQSLLKAQRRKQFEKHDAELLALPAIPLSAPKTFVPSLTARI